MEKYHAGKPENDAKPDAATEIMDDMIIEKQAHDAGPVTADMVIEVKTPGEPEPTSAVERDLAKLETRDIAAELPVDLDQSPAPEGRIGGELGELDAEMEVKATALDQPQDLDQSPSPEGPIRGDLGKLDRVLEAKEKLKRAYEDHDKQSGSGDDQEMKKAA